MAFVRYLVLISALASIAFALWPLGARWGRKPIQGNSETTRSNHRVGSILAIVFGVSLLVGVFTGEVDKETEDYLQISAGFSQLFVSLLHPKAAMDWALRYKEAILNLLDLVSFLLITPELLDKYSELPKFGRAVSIVSSAFAVLAFGTVLWLFLSAQIYAAGASTMTKPVFISRDTLLHHNFSIALVIVVAVLCPMTIFIYVRFGEPLSLAAARHWLLWCGVTLFLLTRVLGLVAGLHSEAASRHERADLQYFRFFASVPILPDCGRLASDQLL